MPEHKIDDPTCGCWGCIELHNSARSSLSLLAKERARVDLVAPDELGVVSPPLELSLLEQLKMASELKGSKPGQMGGCNASGVPVDLVAVEMFESIGRELHWDAISLLARDPDSVEDVFADSLALLGRVDSLPGDVLEARVEKWRGWVVQIQAYLSPERRTPVPGVCPADGCGQSQWFSYDDEGGRVSEHALVALWEGERVDSVMCSCCYSVWPRYRLWELGQALGQGFDFRSLAQSGD